MNFKTLHFATDITFGLGFQEALIRWAKVSPLSLDVLLVGMMGIVFSMGLRYAVLKD